MNVRDRYRDEFRIEATERVERLLALFDGHHLTRSELGDLRRETHGIKGTASMFGDPPIAALALALETLFAGAYEQGSLADSAVKTARNGLSALLERCKGMIADDSRLIAELNAV